MTQVAQDPADALQVGLYELLTDDSELALLASVYDGPPETAAPAYVVIGEMTAIPDGAQGEHGRQTSVVLHTWTKAESFRPGNVIGNRLAALLEHRHVELDPLVDGHRVWRVAHEFSQTLVDPEPGYRHRIDRFRIWTSQEGA